MRVKLSSLINRRTHFQDIRKQVAGEDILRYGGEKEKDHLEEPPVNWRIILK
jgi:hypothetical protein